MSETKLSDHQRQVMAAALDLDPQPITNYSRVGTIGWRARAMVAGRTTLRVLESIGLLEPGPCQRRPAHVEMVLTGTGRQRAVQIQIDLNREARVHRAKVDAGRE